jgi:hypothetical protein
MSLWSIRKLKFTVMGMFINPLKSILSYSTIVGGTLLHVF